MNVQCTLTDAAGNTTLLTHCLQFSLLRERYQADSVLHARFLLHEPLGAQIRAVFAIGSQTVFDGIVQDCACLCEKGERIFRFSGRSYTGVLTKNQLVPGIHTQVTLQSLMETYQLPHITYDPDVPEINYIYVKENAAMWDSVIAYNYKLNGGFPYIRVPNALCMLPQTGTAPISLPLTKLLACSEGGQCSEMISRIDMANAAGDYGTFTQSNPEAALRDIVRVRQIPLDKQYLYAPDDALSFRIALSNRRMHIKSFRYLGYAGEDIEDLMQIGTDTARVSRILITGSRSGIVTEDSFYYDPFCNRP